ncbi:MAG: ion transporter [Methanomicrobiaceae archaeon]|nr:ion transporter [Methanomicrobiaceae archaeon]
MKDAYGELKDCIFFLLEEPANHNPYRKAVIYTIFALITLNVIMVVLETERELYLAYEPIFHWVEIVSVAVFTVEYGLRIWVCTEHPDYAHPVWGRLRFALAPLMLVDLVAIAPFYLPLMFALDLRILRIVRLTRVFRVLKLGRYSHAWETFAFVFRSKKEELLIAIVIIFVILTVSSSAMYFAEHEAQPEKFSSIPDAMWWGVVTLSTVGYGDIYPITPVGKLIGAVVALSGIALFALPAGIIVAGLAEWVQVKHRMECMQEGAPPPGYERPKG